jgi:hypothetical protein
MTRTPPMAGVLRKLPDERCIFYFSAVLNPPDDIRKQSSRFLIDRLPFRLQY